MERGIPRWWATHLPPLGLVGLRLYPPKAEPCFANLGFFLFLHGNVFGLVELSWTGFLGSCRFGLVGVLAGVGFSLLVGKLLFSRILCTREAAPCVLWYAHAWSLRVCARTVAVLRARACALLSMQLCARE